MEKISLIILMLVSTLSWGQQREFKLIEEIPSMSTMFLAGAFNGVSQDVLFLYNEFENTFPNTYPQFWDPSISWVNKYKNQDPLQGARFPGSTTILVGTTDGYHAMLSSRDIMIVTSIALSSKSRSWKHFLKKTAVYTLAYSAGFHLTYRTIIK
jgi:hypothetical protein